MAWLVAGLRLRGALLDCFAFGGWVCLTAAASRSSICAHAVVPLVLPSRTTCVAPPAGGDGGMPLDMRARRAAGDGVCSNGGASTDRNRCLQASPLH